MKTSRIVTIVASVIALTTGCSPNIQRNPVPEELIDVAQVKNLEDIRNWSIVRYTAF